MLVGKSLRTYSLLYTLRKHTFPSIVFMVKLAKSRRKVGDSYAHFYGG